MSGASANVPARQMAANAGKVGIARTRSRRSHTEYTAQALAQIAMPISPGLKASVSRRCGSPSSTMVATPRKPTSRPTSRGAVTGSPKNTASSSTTRSGAAV